jgi:hypothetical protein
MKLNRIGCGHYLRFLHITYARLRGIAVCLNLKMLRPKREKDVTP